MYSFFSDNKWRKVPWPPPHYGQFHTKFVLSAPSVSEYALCASKVESLKSPSKGTKNENFNIIDFIIFEYQVFYYNTHLCIVSRKCLPIITSLTIGTQCPHDTIQTTKDPMFL